MVTDGKTISTITSFTGNSTIVHVFPIEINNWATRISKEEKKTWVKLKSLHGLIYLTFST